MNASTETKTPTLTVSAYSNLYLDFRSPFYPHSEGGVEYGRGYQDGDPLFRAATVEVDFSQMGSVAAIMGWVFRELNIGEAGDLVEQWRGNRCASMSVGDVVVIGESAFAVDKAGWKPISLTADQIKDESGRGITS